MKTTRTLAILSLALAGACLAADEQDEQREVALTYLKRLGDGTLDLKKDTALSPHCTNQRLLELDSRVEFIRKNSFRPHDKLSVLTVKTDGQLAATLVKAENPASLISLRIHTVALIKKEGSWLAAPLPGLFTNAGYGYNDEIERSARSLERWMASEQILLQARHRDKTTSELSSSLAPIEKAAGHDKMNPEQATSHLIEQCRRRNIRGILASMGAASGALESTMDTTLQSIEHGLKTADAGMTYWHFLTNRSVLAEAIEFDKKHSVVAVGFYDPAEDRSWYQYDIFYFPSLTIDSKTFAHLDPDFTNQSLDTGQDNRPNRPHRQNESSRKRKLATAFITKNPGIASASPEQLLARYLKSIGEKNFTDFLRLIPPHGEFIQKDTNHQSVIDSVGSHWKDSQSVRMHTTGQGDKAPAILVEDSIALAPVSYTTSKRVSEFQTMRVWMLKDAQGWYFIPPDILTSMLDDDQLSIVNKLTKQLEATEEKRQQAKAAEYIKEVISVKIPLKLKAPSGENARKVLLDYRKELKQADPKAALNRCAVIDGTPTNQTMKAFNLAHRGALDHTGNDHILGAVTEGNWHGISLKTESRLSGEQNYPLYLFASTATGPRILIDLDFRYPTNKGRLLLNKRNWTHLEQILPEQSLKAIRAIFDQHNKLCEQDLKDTPESD